MSFMMQKPHNRVQHNNLLNTLLKKDRDYILVRKEGVVFIYKRSYFFTSY